MDKIAHFSQILRVGNVAKYGVAKYASNLLQ